MTWVDTLFAFINKSGTNITITELVEACMPTNGNVWDCTGSGACVKITYTTEQRQRIGAQGALRYIMQMLALDATEQTHILQDNQISIQELRTHANKPFYDLFEVTDEVAHVLPLYQGYFDDAIVIIRTAFPNDTAYQAQVDSLVAQMTSN